MTTAAESRPRKPKKCKTCAEPFQPMSMTHVCCSIKCSAEFARSKREAAELKEQRADTKARKEKIKPRSQWMKEAQQAVNRFCRVRDSDKPCVSCDRPANWGGQWHASHFRSVGAASAVRFNLWNIHKACSICNHHLSGNISGYRPRLIERIGIERVEWLERQNKIVKYDIEYLKRLKAVFTKKTKMLEKMRGL